MAILRRCAFHSLQSVVRRYFKSQAQATMSRPDHLELTAGNTRQEEVLEAVVTDIEDLSPTVKGLTLKLNKPGVTFKAGQWVDFHLSEYNIKEVCGYSMCCGPKKLSESQSFDLAVQYSEHPPTYWVHTKCEVGSPLQVKVGGDFFYDPQPGDAPKDVLLIAGGLGINPMMSMLYHAADLRRQNKEDESVHRPRSVKLLYSAKTPEELIFKQNIDDIVQQHENFSAQYFVTSDVKPTENNVHRGRISRSIVEQSLKTMASVDQIRCYICGPGPMLDDMENYLISLGVNKPDIHYEKWW